MMEYSNMGHVLGDGGGRMLIDIGFEPQTRARSNTWPCPHPEDNNNTMLSHGGSPAGSSGNNSANGQPMSQDICATIGAGNGAQSCTIGGQPSNATVTNGTGTILEPGTNGVVLSPAQNGTIGAGGTPVTGNNGAPNTPTTSSILMPKKSSSRRNAWGNLSYADLITQAIGSSPDKRLTLSQIYDWMVSNVAYFKDKGDSNSSAGWKNSIRHNLSLHNRFVRVQNEGTGKSSWWMLNPDAKPGKAARRRAASMETSKYEKKRGRLRKKIEAQRNGTLAVESPTSSLGEGLDIFPDSPLAQSFQLSPDFRPRASSNASSCGRLSPIPCGNEILDLHDNQVPPMSPWPEYATFGAQYGSQSLSNPGGSQQAPGALANSLADRFATDQLAGNLENTMKLTNELMPPPNHVPDFGSNGFSIQNYSSAQVTSVNNRGSNANSATPNITPEFESLLAQKVSVGQGGSGGSVPVTMPQSYFGYSVKSEPEDASLPHQMPLGLHLEGNLAHQHNPHPNPSELDFNVEQLASFDCDVDEVLKSDFNLNPDIEFSFDSSQQLATVPNGASNQYSHEFYY